MKKNNKLLKAILPLVIIIVSVFIMKTLFARRASPGKTKRNEHAALVDTVSAKSTEQRVIISANGDVHSAREISIIAQVSGKVAYISEKMKSGGFFKKGETMFKIEDIDFRLALDQSRATVMRAEYDLATAGSRAKVARAEWDRINKDKKIKPNPLVLNEPQLKTARAGLSAARATLGQAELNLARTTITAPFDCRVRSENIDLGQYIRPVSSVATIAGTNVAEVEVPLSPGEMQWITLPDNKGKVGSPATVSMKINKESVEWTGRLARSTGEISPVDRLVHVIIEVEDPYGLKKDNAKKTLPSGSYVSVRIKGALVKGVFSLPGTALRDNSTVWIMDSTSRLNIRKVKVLRIEQDEVLISGGLKDGDKIITTTLAGITEKMLLRGRKEKPTR